MARKVKDAVRTLTTATSATTVTTSRALSEWGRTRIRTTGSVDRLEDVAGSPHGMDHRGPSGVDLLAQVGHVELHHVGLTAEVVVPHPVQDLRLRQHPARVAHQEPEQLELGRGEVDLVVAAEDLVAVLVETQVADGEHRGV